jgi:L-glutamine-phosphate cytidylyltransferase
VDVIILGAGRGIRLGPSNPGVPKLLLEVGGQTILDKQVAALRRLNWIGDIHVVVGFCKELVREKGGPELRYIDNDNFDTTNTAASLQCALQAVGRGAIVLNGDVVFDDAAVACLADVQSGAICEFKEVDPEEIQVILGDDDAIVRIGKDIGGVAEAVGIYRFGDHLVRAYLDEYRAERDARTYYEDVFNRVLAAAGPFQAVALEDARAVEIDTPADLERAIEMIQARTP